MLRFISAVSCILMKIQNFINVSIFSINCGIMVIIDCNRIICITILSSLNCKLRVLFTFLFSGFIRVQLLPTTGTVIGPTRSVL